MAEHSPGEWTKELVEAVGSSAWKIRDANGRLIANLRSETEGDAALQARAAANASLMVTAPDLLAACQEAADRLHDNAYGGVRLRLLAAIASATAE